MSWVAILFFVTQVQMRRQVKEVRQRDPHREEDNDFFVFGASSDLSQKPLL
jgi:hypothetical protein